MEVYSKPERIYTYQYQSDNRSLVARFLRHWWKFAFRFVPRDASANAVSMVGNLGSLASLILLVFIAPDHGRQFPWLFALAAFGIFFYHTLDSIDGMQARRIGSNGPLGEFIDHWFDSFNVFFIPLGAIAAFPVVPDWMAIAVILLFVLADWSSLREVEETNVLYFPPVSSEEGIVFFILFNLSVFFLGYDFWASPTSLFGLAPISIAVLAGIVGLCFTIAASLLRNRGKGFVGLLCIVAFAAPIIVWIAECRHLFNDRSALIGGLFAIGFTGARFTGDLLRTRLVGLKYPYYYVDLAVTGIVVAGAVAAQTLVPGLPQWFPIAAMFLNVTVLLFGLYSQFARMLKRVYDFLGVGLFDVAPAAERDEAPTVSAEADIN